MTIYGWDASHFDGTLTQATLQQAKNEGIEFFTHKLGEGITHADDDSTQTTALNAAKAVGIQVIGGYWFGHNADDPVAEADLCINVADTHEPWWRDFPGWFWQADCETESTNGKPSKTWIQKFSDRLHSQTGKAVIVYASAGQYGDTLAGLTYPLWNAHYYSNAQKPFKDLYPGDDASGWNKYSGQVPVLLQYTSSATIAGKTTCDANAYRGTIQDLLNLIGAGPVTASLNADDVKVILNTDGIIPNPSFRSDSTNHVPPGTNAFIAMNTMLQTIATEANVAHTNTTSLGVKADAQAQQLSAIQDQLTALGGMVNQILTILQQTPPTPPAVSGDYTIQGDVTLTPKSA